MNLNKLAKEICKREGGDVQSSIAQVKEILRIFGDIQVEQLINKDDYFSNVDQIVENFKEDKDNYYIHRIIYKAAKRMAKGES